MPILVFLLLFGYGWASLLPNGCPADFSINRLLPHEIECGKFYACSNGQRVLMQCPRGLSFDEILQICNWPQDIDSTTLRTTPSETTTTRLTTTTTNATTPINTTAPIPPDTCPSEWQVKLKVPEDSDCDKYFHCSEDIKLLLKCPKKNMKNFYMMFSAYYTKNRKGDF
ncbi:peritrophin-1-like [Maniola jurtina]|uniref:peritrophin-1-like n=1 Tax=Maniola jurtina TaxID=191418 RepID=UPI001E68D80E|nr:peritrophin-1-like [Maniola jurtina]